MRPVLLVAALLAFAGAARAQDPHEDAKIHYKAGASYYKSGDWRSAKREFEHAYRLSRRGPLLFNIALCEEKLGEYGSAVASLKLYLATPEGQKESGVVEGKIREDQVRAERREAAPLADSPTMEARTVQLDTPGQVGGAPMPATRKAGLGLVGVGGAVLVAAVALAVVAHGDYGSLEERCGPKGDACPPGFEPDRDRGRTLALTADVLIGVGVGTLVAATALILWRPRRPAPVTVLPSGNGLAVTF